MKDFYIENVQSVLLDCVIENCSPQAVLDRLYKLTEIPMIAFDLSFHLIAYAFPIPFYLPGWDQMVSQGRVTEKMVLSQNYLEVEEALFSSNGSVVINTDDKYPAAFAVGFGRSGKNSEPLGYFASVIEHENTDKVIEFNSIVSSALFSLIVQQKNEFSSSQMLRIMINSTNISKNHSRTFTQMYNGPYALSVLQTDGASFATAAYIDSSINSNSDSLISMTNGKNLYILAYALNGSSQRQSFKRDIAHFCSEYSYTAGISDFFYDIEHLHQAMEQAKSSLLLYPTFCDNKVISFSPHYIDIICALSLQDDFNDNYQFQDIYKLKNSGLANWQCFLETLEIYLNNMQNILLTSNILGIHKNTVKYRLLRIQEILGLDLNDSSSFEKLFLELHLYRMYLKSKESKA